jgi:hypothetical protein
VHDPIAAFRTEYHDWKRITVREHLGLPRAKFVGFVRYDLRLDFGASILYQCKPLVSTSHMNPCKIARCFAL